MSDVSRVGGAPVGRDAEDDDEEVTEDREEDAGVGASTVEESAGPSVGVVDMIMKTRETTGGETRATHGGRRRRDETAVCTSKNKVLSEKPVMRAVDECCC